MRVRTIIRVVSRQVGALILDDLLKNVVQDGFGIVRIFHVLRDAKDISAFANIVLYVFVGALVRELGHLDLF